MRLVALVFAFLLITPAASAGNWAVTYLDPLPGFEPGRSYTLGYWVLQHGNHPYEGKLETGLKFVGQGKELSFSGVPLRETSHYAAAVYVPEGTWKVYGVQGVFADHDIGTLTVPGSLVVHPMRDVASWPGAAKTWQDISPPSVPAPVPAAVTTELPAQQRPLWVVGLGLVAVALVGLTLRLRRS